MSNLQKRTNLIDAGREARRRERLPRLFLAVFYSDFIFSSGALRAQSRSAFAFCRLDLKHPPTAVGGISALCAKPRLPVATAERKLNMLEFDHCARK
jgi:hypothetical protein